MRWKEWSEQRRFGDDDLELMAFEDGWLQKAIGKELKPSLQELSHIGRHMKDRPTHKTGGEAEERRRKTRKKCVNSTSRTLQKQGGHSSLYSFLFWCCDKTSDKSNSRMKGLILAQSPRGIESIMEKRYRHRQGRHGNRNRKLTPHISTLRRRQ